MTPCAECWARYVCSGGCVWSGQQATGSVYRMDDRRCGLIRHTVEAALKIYCRLSEEDKQQLERAAQA